MKTLKRATFLAMAIIMLFSISALAVDNQTMEPASDNHDEKLMCYYDGEGRMLTNIDGEVFQVITPDPSKAKVVSDGSGYSAFSSILPVPPTYDYDMSIRPYQGSVNFTYINESVFTPILKRLKTDYTRITMTNPKNVTTSINLYYYDELKETWYSEIYMNLKFGGVLLNFHDMNFTSAGTFVPYIRLQFFNYNTTSPKSFQYTLRDV